MKTRKESNEVHYPEDLIVCFTDQDLESLKEGADSNPRKRIRLCSHPSPADALHEMLIVLKKGACILPHRHPNKSESIHCIEGEADLVLFTDEGEITRILSLGQPGPGRIMYCRMNTTAYHALLIRSDFFIFHETTNGPFRNGDTHFAPWCPAISDPESCRRYLEHLEKSIDCFSKEKMED